MRASVGRMRNRLAREAAQAHQEMALTSTVPVHALDLDDPMLEAALTDSAMQFFLQHMTAFDNQSGAIEADVLPHHEAVPVEELRRTFDMIAQFDSFDPPDLRADIDAERFWILIDLVSVGDPLSQHRATLEIREIMSQAQDGELDEVLVQTYLDGLRAMPRHPLLLEMLVESLDDAPHRQRIGSTS